GHRALSPRLRVSFPVTEKTGFRLSYSHQVQTPEFTTLLTGVNNDLSFTNTNDVFGRDLKFGKTILFEFGVRHAFSQDLVLDVSAYNKDKVSDYAARILPFVSPRQASETLSVNVLTNGDFGNSKGIDFKLDYRLDNYVNAFVTFYARSGLPYTLLVNNGDGQTVPHLSFGLGGRAAENLNASVLPWTTNVDVRINKGFRVGRLDWTLYADIRNVFNFKNIAGVYAETGDVTNSLLKDKTISPEVQNLKSEASQAGALTGDGSVDLTLGCGGWGIPANCEALKQIGRAHV